jgi:N-acyl-phosphatidylethanolamine-hydrolysing phospholipase D
MADSLPAHHRPDGGFRNPWPDGAGERGFGDFLRWRRERNQRPLPPLPDARELPRARPEAAHPRGRAGETRITWVGHSSFLLQLGPFNVLTDPVWSEHASPLPWIGPRRLVPAAIDFAALPPIDAVLLSHDHYDHLDRPTIRRLVRRFGDTLHFITPLGYRDWLHGRRARTLSELDWWQAERLSTGSASLTVMACPAQHWTRRRPLVRSRRLWASFVLDAGPGARVYFAGDSGYCPAFAEIGQRAGPFDAALLPIGAYEPRWFMRAAHMNPEEAVQAWRDLGGRGRFVAMHWGTFILTDEPALEPPARTRRAWAAAGGSPRDLSILRHGETLTLGGNDGAGTP